MTVRSYLKAFIRYNRTNEVGWGLLIVTVGLTGLYAILAYAVTMQGGQVAFGWWAAPIVGLWVITVAHWGLRPIVSAHYSHTK